MTSNEIEMETSEKEMLEKGHMQHGCTHYRRRCHIRAPCCNEVFDCRHCHNEAKNNLDVDKEERHDLPRHEVQAVVLFTKFLARVFKRFCLQNNLDVDKEERHDLPRHEVQAVICSLCGTEQEVRQVCINCGVCMGKYFCQACKLFDDDTSKNQYHCEGCGICRIGGQENFFHCYKCRCCYSNLLKNDHPCVDGAMHHDCPVCFEYLFDTLDEVSVLPCGHTIHYNCLQQMKDHFKYACPLCSKSVYDMSKVWERFDMEIASTPMPEQYQNQMVSILCNDCRQTSEVKFHVVAHKCPNCKSYNTRQIRG